MTIRIPAILTETDESSHARAGTAGEEDTNAVLLVSNYYFHNAFSLDSLYRGAAHSDRAFGGK